MFSLGEGRGGYPKLNVDPANDAPSLESMTDEPTASGVEATCHCGTVKMSLAKQPTEVTECNCSLCRSYGVIWFYCSASEVTVSPDPSLTDTYAWNGRHVDFHRCRQCGCVTHWMPRDDTRDRRGVNARLLPPDVLAAAKVRHLDGAVTGKYLD
jgi:hypothetical protein